MTSPPTTTPTPDPPPAAAELPKQQYVRAKLFDGDKSSLRRYADLVVGEGASYAVLLKYELITFFFAGVRGALGLQLRKMLYPMLFKSCGRGVIFGRNLTIRNAANITLGDRVVIDDDCVLDARGAGERGVVIGQGTILNRGVSVQAKIGPVHIGRECDIGMHSDVHSQGGAFIGDQVVLGGSCKISGGVFQIDRTPGNPGNPATPATPGSSPAYACGAPADDREQSRTTRGPIRIDAKCLVGMGSMFLDGVHIGEGSVIGAGSLMNKSIPPYTVAAGVPGKVLRQRPHRDDLAVH